MLNLTNENTESGIFSNLECEINPLQVQAKKDAEKMGITGRQIVSLLLLTMRFDTRVKGKINDLIEMLEILVSFYKEILNKYLDELIEISIEKELHEITVFLLDYKYKNNLFAEKDWSL